MKIKTITCHEVYNYGASLQEYALLQFLYEQGWQASVLHYKPPYLSGHFNMWSVSARFDKPLLKQLYLLTKLPSRLKALKKKKAFDLFHQKYIPTDLKLYRNNKKNRKLKYQKKLSRFLSFFQVNNQHESIRSYLKYD